MADGDFEFRQVMAGLLEDHGYEAFTLDGEHGLRSQIQALLATAGGDPPYDVIVCDVAAKGNAGLDLLRAVRATAWLTPVVVVVGLRDTDVQLQARGLGAIPTGHIQIKFGELLDLVRQLAPSDP